RFRHYGRSAHGRGARPECATSACHEGHCSLTDKRDLVVSAAHSRHDNRSVARSSECNAHGECKRYESNLGHGTPVPSTWLGLVQRFGWLANSCSTLSWQDWQILSGVTAKTWHLPALCP